MIFIYLLSIFATYAAFWMTYRIFTHPLNKYPGPFFAQLSDIYNGYHAFKRHLHLTTWVNQQRYGSVIRQGPNKLVFNSVTALRDIYRSDRTTKPKAYMALGPGLTTYNIFSAVDNNLHRARRQVIGPVLTERSIRVFEPTMVDQVSISLQKLLKASQNSEPVNISRTTRQLGINIAALLAFGYDLRLQTDETNQFMLTVLDSGTWASNVALHFPLVRQIHLGILMMLPLLKVREKYLRLVETMITSRSALPYDAKHDLYSFVGEAFASPSGGLRKSDLWSEANLFLAAAGETTNTAISATFFYLSRHHDVYQKLVHEIRTSFASAEQINGSGLTACTYLRACIDESLRLSPPAPSILWRELVPGEESSKTPFVVDGHVIPKGTIVGVSTYSLHHNDAYFPDPFSFNPERWLDTSTFSSETKKLMREAFVPFSIGSRACAGKAMAYLETGLTLAMTIWYFDFKVARGSLGKVGGGQAGFEKRRRNPGEFQLYDVFGASHDGPYLTFKPRGDFWKEL